MEPHNQTVMLGGYRAGKSSILASILYSLSEETKGDIFTVSDDTDYTVSDAPVKLQDKRIEVSQFLKNKSSIVGASSSFLVDMNPTIGSSTYTLSTRVDGADKVQFQFVDVAGEYMEETHHKYNELKDIVAHSNIFVVAIDTPYMMDADNDINEKYNRVEEITKLLKGLGDDIEDVEVEKKLVIFCPVKCETWVRSKNGANDSESRHGCADQVTDMVKRTYRTLINTLVKQRGVEMWIMPIQTVGCLEFSEMTPAYRYFKDSNDNVGQKCSYLELTGNVRLFDGMMIPKVSQDKVSPDESMKRDGVVDIPFAWYKLNGEKTYSPQLCEQPAYHILRFLLDRQLALSNEKYEELKRKGWLSRFFIKVLRLQPPFGEYVDAYRNAIGKLKANNRLKESGDGFCKIYSIID